MITDKEAQDLELAEKHWEFLEKWLHMIFVDAWVHSAKHTRAEKEPKE